MWVRLAGGRSVSVHQQVGELQVNESEERTNRLEERVVPVPPVPRGMEVKKAI